MIKGLYEAHLPVSNLDRSISFYESIGLQLASKEENVAFMWIMRGQSWIGLWEGDKTKTPYHPSLRHIAFHVEYEDLKRAKDWLNLRGIEVREAFGLPPKGAIAIANTPQTHGMIYFHDPDGNSLEFICPIKLDGGEDFGIIYLDEWEKEEST